MALCIIIQSWDFEGDTVDLLVKVKTCAFWCSGIVLDKLCTNKNDSIIFVSMNTMLFSIYFLYSYVKDY